MAIHSARKTTRRGSAKVGFGSWWFVRLVSCPMWVVLLLILSVFVLWKNTFCLLDTTICKPVAMIPASVMWLHMQKQILILINTSAKSWKYRGVSRMTESVARCNKNYVVLSILQLRSLQLIAGGSSNVRSRDSSSLGPTRSLFTCEEQNPLSFWTSPGFIWCHFSCLISLIVAKSKQRFQAGKPRKVCASQVWFRHSW